jgi:hypothetical protein
VPAVSADDDAGVLGDGRASLRVAADDGDATVLEQDLLNRETFADLAPASAAASTRSLSRTAPSTRAVAHVNAFSRPRPAGDCERSEVAL